MALVYALASRAETGTGIGAGLLLLPVDPVDVGPVEVTMWPWSVPSWAVALGSRLESGPHCDISDMKPASSIIWNAMISYAGGRSKTHPSHQAAQRHRPRPSCLARHPHPRSLRPDGHLGSPAKEETCCWRCHAQRCSLGTRLGISSASSFGRSGSLSGKIRICRSMQYVPG